VKRRVKKGRGRDKLKLACSIILYREGKISPLLSLK
jgi:hypothetical protein